MSVASVLYPYRTHNMLYCFWQLQWQEEPLHWAAGLASQTEAATRRPVCVIS
jgi:hypothetical protein